jgi:SAM-dependent methyltransferase
MNDSHPIFDRKRLRMHRDLASASFADFDFLTRAMDERIAESLKNILSIFPVALNIGAHTGGILEFMGESQNGIETFIQADASQKMIGHAKGIRLVAETEQLPFAENSLNLIVSSGSLHWANDLAEILKNIHRTLKPNGLFMAIIPGGKTLIELRQSYEQAELSMNRKPMQHVSPFLDENAISTLMHDAGFYSPVVESETLAIAYDHPLQLLQDLRGMGESNALIDSVKGLSSGKILNCVCEYYRNHFSNPQGDVYATFELIMLLGWKVSHQPLN